jgi:hypothetical protein
MTMAKIRDGEVVEIGIPDDLKDATSGRLHHYGWRPVKGLPKPTDGAGHEYIAPYTYDAEEDAVYGTWQQTDIRKEIQETRIRQIRNERDELLEESDYAVLPDAPVTDVEEWKTYRQALRDLPEQEGFPQEVVWPQIP